MLVQVLLPPLAMPFPAPSLGELILQDSALAGLLHALLPSRAGPVCLGFPQHSHTPIARFLSPEVTSLGFAHLSPWLPEGRAQVTFPAPRSEYTSVKVTDESSDSGFILSCNLEYVISHILLASGPLCVKWG